MDLNKKLDEGKVCKVKLENNENLPKAREYSQIIYDKKDQRLLIFGGWSNDFRNDMFQLNVGAITGPDYAIYDIEPKMGPLTGGTNCLIIGEGFKSTCTFYVKFVG